MSRPLPQHLTLQSPIRNLRVERAEHSWMIWLSANKDFTLGTFIELHDSGGVHRVTWHPDGSETVFEVIE